MTGKRSSEAVFSLILIFLLVLGCVPASQKTATEDMQAPAPEPSAVARNEVNEAVRQKVTSAGTTRRVTVNGKSVKVSAALPALYQKQEYKAIWIGESGPTPQANEMIEAVRESYKEGLNPEDYYITDIEALLARINAGGSSDTGDLADLEILLSNSFLSYGRDLLYGQITPEQINLELIFGERHVDMTALLITAVSKNEIAKTLQSLYPNYPAYAKLRTALEYYRKLEAEGGWRPIPPGPRLEMGAKGPRVTALKERLAVTGELASPVPAGDVFDRTVDQAVKKYQEENGLHVDGVVGDSTVESLNVPADVRVQQIELTMERWRLLPQNMGAKFVLVNIANYHLYAVENNTNRLDMRIVVGKPEWNTPIFSEQMTHVVLNPYWNIPPSIFKDDIAPMIKSDPNYMSNRNIQAVGLKYVQPPEGADEAAIASAKEEYASKVLSGNYRLRQDPGPSNPLGRIKFLFPNKHSVYLHDTPNKGYFQRSQRNFSHGCIRVEKPYELAEFVLAPDPSWNHDTIKSAISKGRTQTLDLSSPLPVYILYFTAWVNDDGSVSFHKDVYGLDQILQNALLQSKGRTLDMASNAQ